MGNESSDGAFNVIPFVPKDTNHVGLSGRRSSISCSLSIPILWVWSPNQKSFFYTSVGPPGVLSATVKVNDAIPTFSQCAFYVVFLSEITHLPKPLHWILNPKLYILLRWCRSTNPEFDGGGDDLKESHSFARITLRVSESLFDLLFKKTQRRSSRIRRKDRKKPKEKKPPGYISDRI